MTIYDHLSQKQVCNKVKLIAIGKKVEYKQKKKLGFNDQMLDKYITDDKLIASRRLGKKHVMVKYIRKSE